MEYGSQAYTFYEGNLLTTVTYRSVCAWQPKRCVLNGNILWWDIAQGCSPSLTPLGHCDRDGVIYTRKSGEPERVITCFLKDIVSGQVDR